MKEFQQAFYEENAADHQPNQHNRLGRDLGRSGFEEFVHILFVCCGGLISASNAWSGTTSW